MYGYQLLFLFLLQSCWDFLISKNNVIK